MALTKVIAIGNGVTDTFAVNFALGYISKDHISCQVGDEKDGAGNPIYRTITFLSDNLIKISGAIPADGIKVKFLRTVPKTELIIDFDNGDTLEESNLDTAQKQAAMQAQEALDGRIAFSDDLSLVGFRLKDVGSPVNDNDAVTKKWIEQAGDFNLAAAIAAKNSALASAIAAAVSASEAKKSSGHAISPWDRGADGKGGANDRIAIQTCVDELQALQNNLFISTGIIDGRGGTFAIAGVPITLKDSPYNLTFQNMGVQPFGTYAGDLFDLSACPAATNISWIGCVLNGYNRCKKLIRMSNKTQGSYVTGCLFYGFVEHAFFDPSTVPATENRIVNNVFQGSQTVNQGTCVEISGNDSEVLDNVMYNCVTGVRIIRGAVNVMRNHIYSVDPNSPIAAVLCDDCSQVCISENYVDCAYLYLNKPSLCRIMGNKFFMTGTVAGYNPIIMRPVGANATFQSILIIGNMFISMYATYYPVRIDTGLGTVGSVYQTYMDLNTFYGFFKQATSPIGTGVVTAATFVAHNFGSQLPWGTLRRIWGGTINSADGFVQIQTISGTVGFLSFGGVTCSGNYTVQGTCNDDFI